MLHVQSITSLDLPELAPYRTMRRQWDHREQGIFVAEGEKVVRRLLESELGLLSLLLPSKWLRDYEPLLQKRSETIHAFVADKQELEKLTGFSMYQGVMAVGKVPAAIPLEELIRRSLRPFLWAAVDGLSNAENLGALVRNCVAFGVQVLLVGETCGSPYLRRAVRNSMGTIFKLPIVETASLAATIQTLRPTGMRFLGAHPHSDRHILSKADLSGDCCLVFGSEGEGISPSVLEVCDDSAAVPMQSGVDSLNVGSAAAVFLYEANRQRGTV